jgi:hypothetical protein
MKEGEGGGGSRGARPRWRAAGGRSWRGAVWGRGHGSCCCVVSVLCACRSFSVREGESSRRGRRREEKKRKKRKGRKEEKKKKYGNNSNLKFFEN